MCMGVMLKVIFFDDDGVFCFDIVVELIGLCMKLVVFMYVFNVFGVINLVDCFVVLV